VEVGGTYLEGPDRRGASVGASWRRCSPPRAKFSGVYVEGVGLDGVYRHGVEPGFADSDHDLLGPAGSF
jgi:hypothetical protein